MKISMINIIVSAFVLSVTAGLFYLNRRPAENIDDVTMLTLYKKRKNEKLSNKIKDESDTLLVFCCYAVLSVW